MTTAKKGKTPKCKHCGEWVDKSLNLHVYHSNRYYHQACYEIVHMQATHYKELIEYICNLYGIDAPTGWHIKQIQVFKDEYNYTYKGMELTLRFITEVEKKTMLDASEAGIGLIRFYYLKASKYYGNLAEAMESFDGTPIDVSPTIYVRKRKSTNHHVNHTKLIDISSIKEEN